MNKEIAVKRLTHFCPPETTAKLRCPERGFYTILRFKAEEEPVLPESVPLYPDDTLLLVEINLLNYADAALTASASLVDAAAPVLSSALALAGAPGSSAILTPSAALLPFPIAGNLSAL